MSLSETGAVMSQPPSRPSPPVFALLPVEINNQIFALFCDCATCQGPACEYQSQDRDEIQQDLATLSSVSRTSKWLQHPAQPILHHKFPLYLGRDVTTRFFLFVRTLSNRTDLAHEIRFLGLECIAMIHYTSLRPPSYISHYAADIEKVVQAATRFKLKLSPAWWAWWLSGTGNEDGVTRWALNALDPIPRWCKNDGPFCNCFEASTFIVCLAIFLCKNARTVDFGQVPDVHFSNFSQGMLEVLRRPHQALAINRVRLRSNHCPSTLGCLDMGKLGRLAEYMPKLRTLELYFAFYPDTVSNTTVHPQGNIFRPPHATLTDPDLGLLTRLDLVLCSLTEHCLAALLSGLHHLIDLTFISLSEDVVVQYHVADGTPGVAVRPNEVTDILNRRCPHLHKTLRRLTLEHLPEASGAYIGICSSLRNLEAVEEICLGANGLFTTSDDILSVAEGVTPVLLAPLARILPPNIVSLDIFGVDNFDKRTFYLIIQLYKVIYMGEAYFRHLKDIRAWFGHIWEWVEEYHPIQRRAEDDDDDEDDEEDESDEGNQDHDDGGNNDGDGEGGGGWSKMTDSWDTLTEEIAVMTGIALWINPRLEPSLMKMLRESARTLDLQCRVPE